MLLQRTRRIPTADPGRQTSAALQTIGEASADGSQDLGGTCGEKISSLVRVVEQGRGESRQFCQHGPK